MNDLQKQATDEKPIAVLTRKNGYIRAEIYFAPGDTDSMDVATTDMDEALKKVLEYYDAENIGENTSIQGGQPPTPVNGRGTSKSKHEYQQTTRVLEHYSCDEVAECVSGITSATHDELWKATSEAEKAGTDKPRGGDGSDGTFEEPVITSGEYGTDLVAAWPSLSEEARKNICECGAAKMADWPKELRE